MAEESRVYLAQMLCPLRHCLLAAYRVFATAAESEQLEGILRGEFDQAVKSGLLNPWCGLCQSRMLHIEIGRTHFRTMAEAEGPLRDLEAAQARTVAYLKSQQN